MALITTGLAVASGVKSLFDIGKKWFSDKDDKKMLEKIDSVSDIMDVLSAEAEKEPELKQQLLALEVQMEKETTERYKAWATVAKEDSASKDKWTSRARPTGLYVGYLILLFLFVAAPIAKIKTHDYVPKEVINFFLVTHGTAYVGYGVLRTKEKGINILGK